MKPIKFLPIVMIATAGLVASCSTSKLASNNTGDDVYNTVAKAREVEYVAPVQQQQQQAQNNNQEYDEYYGTSNPYYDMDYSSRINRFYNGYSWRGYYDPYYDNYYSGNSYGNTNFLGYGLGWNNGYGLGGWGGGFGYGLGYGYGSIWNSPYNYGYFGYNPYGFGGWGPYSYYDRFGWGGGFYGGGYGIGGGYYGGGYGFTNRNNRARPNRDGDNRGSYGNRSGIAPVSGNYGRPTISNNAGRPERYSNGNNGSNVNGQPGRVSSRPSRDDSYRPQPQTQQVQPSGRPDRGSYSPPAQSSGSSGGGSSSGGGGGGGRPTRGGR